MKKPELVKTNRKGGTIHSYQISGGHTVYNKYLACLNGVCEFHNTIELAETGLEKMIAKNIKKGAHGAGRSEEQIVDALKKAG